IVRTFSQSRRPIVSPSRLEKPQKNPNREALFQSCVPFRFRGLSQFGAGRTAPPLRKGGRGILLLCPVAPNGALLLITSQPLDHLQPYRKPAISHDSSLLITWFPLDQLLTAPSILHPRSSILVHSALLTSFHPLDHLPRAGSLQISRDSSLLITSCL